MNVQIKGILPRAALTASVVVAVLALNGCPFGSKPPEDDDVIPGLESPAGVIKLIEVSYQNRKVEDYKACLSLNFTFYFDEDDVNDIVGDYTIPPSWGYDDEVSAIANMFDQAYSININLNSSTVGTPAEGAIKYEVYNNQISLLVMVDASNGYLAEGFVDYEFESYTEDNEKLWRLTDWWDHTS